MASFTHIDQDGHVRMVDVTDKASSHRIAVARGRVTMQPETLKRIRDHSVEKGNVLEAARIAGIMAAKRTADLIPLCHPLNITHAQIDFTPNDAELSIDIQAEVRVIGQTGVEMEALTAVSIAALTIYDMCKSYDREMTISMIELVKKSGGKSGTYTRKSPAVSDPHP